jgi:hypothetical protein
MTPAAYLAKIAASRALYRKLYEHGMSVLPPSVPGSTKTEPIACGLALGTLAAELKLGRKTVTEDLRRLVGFRWIVLDGDSMQLGHRVGAAEVLHADLAAEEATGERGLIARIVLGQRARACDAEPQTPASGRGGSRKFEL